MGAQIIIPGVKTDIVMVGVDGDGTLFLTETGVKVVGWATLSCARTWGGVGGTVPAMMTMDMDHIYVSGRL